MTKAQEADNAAWHIDAPLEYCLHCERWELATHECFVAASGARGLTEDDNDDHG
jgi:hypothetical protein